MVIEHYYKVHPRTETVAEFLKSKGYTFHESNYGYAVNLHGALVLGKSKRASIDVLVRDTLQSYLRTFTQNPDALAYYGRDQIILEVHNAGSHVFVHCEPDKLEWAFERVK